MPRLMFTVGLTCLVGCAGINTRPDSSGITITQVSDQQVSVLQSEEKSVEGASGPTEYTATPTRLSPPVSLASAMLVQDVATQQTPAPAVGEKVRATAASLKQNAKQLEQVPAESLIYSDEVVGVTINEPTGGVIDQGSQSYADSDTIPLNLPSVLAMVGGQHPAVGFARWRVQEAYARLDAAEALWLPTLQAGFSFHRHDGNYQASDGAIIDINRNSFQYGLGAGATGAGTTPAPGLVARFHLADAIFQPKVAQKTAWARGHRAKSVVNDQLLAASVAYVNLLAAHQDISILSESRRRVLELSKLTDDYATAGEGLRADAERLNTEVALNESRLVASRENAAVASARLAREISLDGGSTIVPMDAIVVPIDLVDEAADATSLVFSALANRPELKESQALVAAACDAYRREKYSPFIPSVLLGMSTGGFGGGTGNNLDNVNGRYDLDAMMTWQVRNLGFGEKAARRQSAARVQQAKFEKLRVMDQIVAEVSESNSQLRFRRQQIEIAKRAIEAASRSHRLNLERIRDGQGLPLEVLQSVQALEVAHRAYLTAVVDFNRAQLELQRAMGWAVTAPAQMQ